MCNLPATAGPPANVLPYTTVAFGCESAGAKTGVAGKLAYHVHANDTAASLPGWPAEPVRVAVSWSTPFFGKPTCTSKINAAPSLGRTGNSSHGDKINTIPRTRPLTVLQAATNEDHNEVTFVLHRQQGLLSHSLFSDNSIISPAKVADLSHDEVSAAVRAMDAIEL